MQAIAVEAFQGLTGRLALLVLLHGLWMSLLIASLLATALHTGRNFSHAWRYRALLLGLVIAAAGPIFVTACHFALARRTAVGDRRDEQIALMSDSGDSTDQSAPVEGREAQLLQLACATFRP